MSEDDQTTRPEDGEAMGRKSPGADAMALEKGRGKHLSWLGAILFTALIFTIPALLRILTTEESAEIDEPETVPVQVVEPPPPPEPEPIEASAAEAPEDSALPPPSPPAEPLQELELADLDFSLPPGEGLVQGSFDYQFAVQDEGFSSDFAFSLEEVDQPPSPLSRPPPSYPYSLRRAGISGEVVLLFVITPEGTVENIEVERSSHSDFNRPAREAVARWRFEPAQRSGEKVPVLVRTTVEFNLR
ncbi:MAG: energy transducer TonB [Opitutales bacterium]|nr:energy transducer TonB [Opitutales bacterium]MCH8540444.1 energy transducer TonB [Opitutales bacterium]